MGSAPAWLIVLACGCASSVAMPEGFTSEQWAALQALSPPSLPLPAPDATNRFADDPAAAHFGQVLFFDPSFSGPLLDTDNDGGEQALGSVGEVGRVSCAGCHVPGGGFSDTRSFQLQISLGAGWGRRRAPSLLDIGQASLVMWDGQRDSLFSQVFGPLESVVEMNSSRLFMAQQMYREHREQYESVFGPMPPLDDASRFPPIDAHTTGCQPSTPDNPAPHCDGPFHGMPGDGAEYDRMSPADRDEVTRVVVNAGKAIGAYERLLSCGPSAFDAWVHGGAPISESAQRGAQLFVGRAHCVECHSGPFMSDQRFHNVGLAPQTVQQTFRDDGDEGAAAGIAIAISSPLNSRSQYSDGDDQRLPASVTPADLGAFRTPTLRCVSQRPTFMHTGQLGSLERVVDFFNRGGALNGYPGTSELEPLGLSDDELADLVAFLRTLEGPGPADALRHPL